MKIKIEGIKLLLEIIEDNSISYNRLVEFTKTKAMKVFIEHERSFDRDISRTMIIKELIELKKKEEYKDKYGFYILKENLSILKDNLLYIEENCDKIISGALENVFKIVPRDIKIQRNIYLYAGGIDGGFTVYRKDIFINYINYFNNLEEFIKVISHELFHCRNISLSNKFKNLFLDNLNSKYIYEILGKILEEGIACLIQHGEVIEKDDPVGTLTKEKIKLIDKKFEELNSVLLKIKEGNIDGLGSVDIYSIGYYMVSSLYKFYGKEAILPWVEMYDYKKPIKSYIKASREIRGESGFNVEIEKWLLNT